MLDSFIHKTIVLKNWGEKPFSVYKVEKEWLKRGIKFEILCASLIKWWLMMILFRLCASTSCLSLLENLISEWEKKRNNGYNGFLRPGSTELANVCVSSAEGSKGQMEFCSGLEERKAWARCVCLSINIYKAVHIIIFRWQSCRIFLWTLSGHIYLLIKLGKLAMQCLCDSRNNLSLFVSSFLHWKGLEQFISQILYPTFKCRAS